MRRGQGFAVDLALGMSLLLVIGLPLAAFMFSETKQAPVQQEAEILAEALLNPHPRSWNQSDVIIPGFAPDHDVNDTQLSQVLAMCPDQIQRVLGLRAQAAFTLRVNGTVTASCGNMTAQAEDVGVSRRYVAKGASIAELEVHVWR